MSREEYLEATERELVALSIGYAEQNGVQTEYDDVLDVFVNKK